MNNIKYKTLWGLWWLFSKLPNCVLYLLADFLYIIFKDVIKYRRAVIRTNIRKSFPEKTEAEYLALEKECYHHITDLLVESIYFFSISKKSIMEKMQFEGLEQVKETLSNGKSIALFLGHIGNWEWVSSLPLWLSDKCIAMQLYHPIENPILDKLVGYSRERFGSKNIPMRQSIRHILKYRSENKPVIVGFIADQAPIWESLNYWVDFLHQDTPVMTGGERIAYKMDMDCYYLNITQVKRGHYCTRFDLITDDVRNVPEYYVTEQYYSRLEKNIKEQPAYWLWTHNRWKRTRQGFVDLLREENRELEIERYRFYDRNHPEGISVAEFEAQNSQFK